MKPGSADAAAAADPAAALAGLGSADAPLAQTGHVEQLGEEGWM